MHLGRLIVCTNLLKEIVNSNSDYNMKKYFQMKFGIMKLNTLI